MNTTEPSRGEKVETLKDIIENIGAINNEMNAQLRVIADELAHVSCPSKDAQDPDEPLSIMAGIRRERDKAEENLALLIKIRECLW